MNLFYWILPTFFLWATTTHAVSKGLNLNQSANSSSNHSKGHDEVFKLVDWKWEELKTYIIYACFILLVVIMKVVYFRIPKLSTYFPESCVLLLVGVVFGIIVRFLLAKESVAYFKLNPQLFFYILLPPIILESAYSLYHRNFLNNIISILIFAVIGTLLNFFIIGFSLWGLAQFGDIKTLNLSLMNCLLFSSLIVAVDPVAVLAIFKEVGVNQDLYYLVFGESLLNDAVTVVLYEMMEEFSTMEQVSGKNIVLGCLSFFTISGGGIIIGAIFGILGCLLLKSMNDKNIELLEPILLISIGYISYLLASIFGWSGIIAMIVCGLIQSAYAMYGIEDKSRIALKRLIKILAAICEALIFLFLGVELVVGNHFWNTGFALSSLFLCLAARFIVTFILAGVINKVHISLHSIPMREKIIISYGGLRGAVAFSLAALIKPAALSNSLMTTDGIITTTLFIVIFTILIQGATVKPFVTVLKITLQSKEIKLSLLDELNDAIIDAVNTGIQGLIGKCGQNVFIMRLEKINANVIRPFLQRNRENKNRLCTINDKINAVLLNELSDKPSSEGLKHLPNSYSNLLMAISNQQANRPKEIEEPRSVVRGKFTVTRVSPRKSESMRESSPKLNKFLIRTSSIQYADEDIHEMDNNLTEHNQELVKRVAQKFHTMKLERNRTQRANQMSPVKESEETHFML